MLNDFKNLQRHGDFMYAVNSGTKLTKIFTLNKTYSHTCIGCLGFHSII